ncbi:type II toxin-antitoxin system VapC family toxin [Devosia ginsengisoli]|nr:type II toxin-antitoxin system VapC family toxin [Devosia ginsengisoli]
MLDTNIVSSLMRLGQGALWNKMHHFGAHHIGVSIISAAELRFGAEAKGSARLTKEVEDFLHDIAVLPFAAPADAHYAQIRAYLKRAGTPIGGNDLFIAAHALALDLTLVTDNIREFSRVPNLRVENWLD